MVFERPILKTLLKRIEEPRGKMQILSGGRQVGKTTLSLQALEKITFPCVHQVAESGVTTSWIDQQWARARALAKGNPNGALLILDEIQKINNWSERIKRLWDEDTASKVNLKVVLLGSSSLLLQRGLTESMAGRYELIHIPHWSLKECENAFGVSVDEYVYFGGYPGALIYRHDEERFLSYIQDAIVEPVVTRDILSQFIVHKPALLRQLFYLGCGYSGQLLSYNKILGQMQDAGNTTTLAHYLTLLAQAEVLTGLPKYSPQIIRQRQSSPKFQVYNNALMTAVIHRGFKETFSDTEQKGRLIESVVGMHLLMDTKAKVYYWRENNLEVDFVVEKKGKLIAIEVKSSDRKYKKQGMDIFQKKFSPDALLLVGSDGIPLNVFLNTPLLDFLA